VHTAQCVLGEHDHDEVELSARPDVRRGNLHDDHDHQDGHGHGHAHGRLDPAVLRTRAGLQAVASSLGVLTAATVIQVVIYVASGSVALLADLIHNGSDALTAVPIGAAFLLRSRKAEGVAGLAVVLTVFISAIVAAVFAVERLIRPHAPTHLLGLALAGLVGVFGNGLAARIRSRAGRALDSPALIADGDHARTDAYVSFGVVLSAVMVGLGVHIADPIIALAVTALILRITVESWQTVRQSYKHPD
jgi:cation diffusion facilitator family transporter